MMSSPYKLHKVHVGESRSFVSRVSPGIVRLCTVTRSTGSFQLAVGEPFLSQARTSMPRSICTEFPSSRSEIATGMPPEAGRRTRKVRRILQSPTSMPRASTVVKAVVIYRFLALLSICVLLNQSIHTVLSNFYL